MIDAELTLVLAKLFERWLRTDEKTRDIAISLGLVEQRRDGLYLTEMGRAATEFVDNAARGPS